MKVILTWRQYHLTFLIAFCILWHSIPHVIPWQNGRTYLNLSCVCLDVERSNIDIKNRLLLFVPTSILIVKVERNEASRCFSEREKRKDRERLTKRSSKASIEDWCEDIIISNTWYCLRQNIFLKYFFHILRPIPLSLSLWRNQFGEARKRNETEGKFFASSGIGGV